MNCDEANQIDMTDYLSSLGYEPTKIRGNDYWYLSPFRQEKEASFKINRCKNIWYDRGLAKGGNVIDFVTEHYRYNVRRDCLSSSFSLCITLPLIAICLI